MVNGVIHSILKERKIEIKITEKIKKKLGQF